MSTILIADSNDDSREVLKILLELWNYWVLEAKDGGEAVNLAEKMLPDLVITEVRMPSLDGFEIATRIRRSKETCKIPIFFLSSCPEVHYRDSTIHSVDCEYLVKPLDFMILENTLAKYLCQPSGNL